MFFIRRNRRPELLSSPLEDGQWRLLCDRILLLDRMPADLQIRLQGVTRLLLAEKNFEGCGGLTLEPDMPLMICAQAALLQLGRGADYFPGLDTVLVYPESFVVDHPRMEENGLVIEAEEELSGESWQQGAVILSWSDVVREAADPELGYNVVLHEFAHQLDDQTGLADGTPLLDSPEQARRWADVFSAAYERHRKALDRNRQVLFDENAAESPAEFFATAAELFFSLPQDLKAEFAALYGVMGDYLGLDPASWPHGSGGGSPQ